MPQVQAAAKQRDESPGLPELERINVTSPSGDRRAAADQHSTQETASRETRAGLNNNNKNSSSSSSKTAATTQQQQQSTTPKVIDIRDLAKPSSSTLQRLNALKHNQLRYFEAEAKYHDELHKLQSKFAQVYGDIFERRRQIVSGECEPSCDECSWPPPSSSSNKKTSTTGDDETKSESVVKNKEVNVNDSSPKSSSSSSANENDEEKSKRANEKSSNGEDEEKGVANFWLEVILSSNTVSSLVYDQDEPVLAYLQDIRVRVDEEKPASSYTLEFEFADNPYFRNRTLTKTFEFSNRFDRTRPFKYRGPDLERTVGCHIDWKPKKNVTVKVIKKKIKARNRKMPPKIITKEEEQPSFFRFFRTHEIQKELRKKKADKETTDEAVAGEKKKEKEEKGKEKETKKQQQPGSSSTSSSVASSSETTSHQSQSDNDDNSDDDSDVGLNSSEIKRVLTETMLTMHDFAVAERLRTKLIPKAVLFMTGEVEKSDVSDEDDDGDEDDDDDDDDDEDDEFYEDDSEEDDTDDDDDEEEKDDEDEDDHEGRAWSKHPAITHMKRSTGGGSHGGGSGASGRLRIGPDDCRPS